MYVSLADGRRVSSEPCKIANERRDRGGAGSRQTAGPPTGWRGQGAGRTQTVQARLSPTKAARQLGPRMADRGYCRQVYTTMSNLSAAAAGTHEPVAPIEHGRFGAVA